MNYSIIIPHKDIPALLQRCLDSIPQRDGLEIVVVDDNSNPKIVDFSKFPGLDRDDVKVIFTKEGRGAGYARNVGLEHVTGKWLLFADADDFFTDKLSAILDKYVDADYDVIYFNVRSVMSDDLSKEANRHKYHNSLFEEELVRGHHTTPWGKMIRKELVDGHNIRFEETMWVNDLRFSCHLAIYAGKIGRSTDCLYVVTFRWGSLSATPSLSKEELLVRVGVEIRGHNLLSTVGNNTRSHFVWQYLYLVIKRLGLLSYIKEYKTIVNKPAFREYVIKHSTTRWRRIRNRLLLLVADVHPK